MHIIQEKILTILEQQDLTNKTLREIAGMVGETSPQKIKHHLIQLNKKGFIKYDSSVKGISKAQLVSDDGFVSLPLVGSANCGPANILAADRIEGYLKVSKRLVPKGNRLFVLRAEGNSMNRATIADGKNIEDGDFIVVDAEKVTPNSGQYVVSIIEDMANVKKFIEDKKNNRIVLESESSSNFLPIYIHEEDQYCIAGTVVDVIKR